MKLLSLNPFAYRLKTEQAYQNYTATEEVALISLVNDAVEHEIASLNGVVATREEIEALRKYSEEHTKAPEILKKVKMGFGDDSASYERLFLSPKIINRKLRQFYSRSPEIHKSERESIEKAYSLVSSGKPFQQTAEQLGLQFKTFEVGTQHTSSAQGTDGSLDASLIPLLEKLSPGEICRSIVEDDYAYKVIRLKERKDKQYQVETITVHKKQFDEWFKKETEKIKIEILDSEFKKSIQIRYPNLRWTPNLSP